jgi:Domain of unknown function (DUF1918)
MNRVTPNIEAGQPGDIIVISAHHIGEPERMGEILESLGTPGHIHYRVRWDDGGESLFYPGSDASIRPSRHHGN